MGCFSLTNPSSFAVHAVLIGVQIIFGIGAVVGKLGLPKTNPVLFAFVREASAGPILVLLAWYFERTLPRANKASFRFFATGLALFANQFCFIVGEKLANAVVGSAWQPTQPIFTAAISIVLGYERGTWAKLIGILLAFGGACFMVFFGADASGGGHKFIGNILFFFNCLGTSLYVIWSKPLLKQYPPMTVTGWSYITASVMMFLTVMVVNSSDSLIRFVCGDDATSCIQKPWNVPSTTVLALLYWIFFNSVLAYLMMTWGNKFAEPSKVLAYTAVQPTTSAILSAILISAGVSGSLKEPGTNALGIIGVIAGLACIVYDNKQAAAREPLLALEDDEEHGSKGGAREKLLHDQH